MSPAKACEVLNNIRFMSSIWVLGNEDDGTLMNYVQGYGSFGSNVISAYGAVGIAEKIVRDDPRAMFGPIHKGPVIRKPPTYPGPPPPEGWLPDGQEDLYEQLEGKTG